MLEEEFGRRSLADVACAFPQSIALFEDAGVDFSCGGARNFAEAELAAGFEINELRALIEAAPPPPESVDWWRHSLGELTHYLAKEHADLSVRRLPALRAVFELSAARLPLLKEVRRIGVLLSSLTEGVAVHAANEDLDLFPRIDERDPACVNDGRLSQLVLRKLVEHEGFHEQLRTMRELSHRIRGHVADDLVAAIEDLSRALHRHMHLENNVLYPRALEHENRRRQRGSAVEKAH